MTQDRRTAVTVGLLFLIAMVTSLVGGIWLESILAAPDYLVTVSENETQVLAGVLLELINAAAVLAIPVLLFPILRRRTEAAALGYVAVRIVEAVILILAVISPLILITLSQEVVAAGASDAFQMQTLGAVVIAARARLAGLLVPIFFSLGAFLLYAMLYGSRLVPRFISVWGLIAVALLLAWNLLEAFGVSISAGMVFGLPIILNEIFLGIWLVAKGFDSAPLASGSARFAVEG